MASFNGWATSLLRAVGAPVTKENLRALGAWQAAEGGSASFNPLNTTQPAHGASNYNSVGVKNFVSPQQGVQATAQTLLNGHYGDIVKLFRSGKASAEQIGTAVSQSPWGTGGGVLRVLGSGPVKIPAAAGATGGQSKAVAKALGSPEASRQALVAMMLDASTASAHGQGMPMSSLMAMAQARQQAQAAADLGPQAALAGGHGPVAPNVNGIAGLSPVPGKIIGTPFHGTHDKAFNARSGSDNWESENAVDISVPIGTPLRAVTSGTIGRQFGSLGSGGRFAGLRLHLVGGGNEYYYAHLSKFAPGIRPGTKVKAGQIIGYSGEANGVPHLHFATASGNPLSFYDHRH